LAALKAETLPFELTYALSNPKAEIDIDSFFPLFSKFLYQLITDIDDLDFVVQRVLQSFDKDGVEYLELRTTPRKTEFMYIFFSGSLTLRILLII
jgi:hypothetical protein